MDESLVGGRPVVERAVVPADGEVRWVEDWAHVLLQTLPSRSSARKAIKRGEMAVEDRLLERSEKIGPGTRLARVEPTGGMPAVFHMDLEVVWEDDHIAAVHKPPGLAVNGNWHRTLEHALPANLQPSGAVDALRLPRPAHRLDRPTGGLVLVGKTARGLSGLSESFHRREVFKQYRAIVIGRLEGQGELDAPVEGREARSRFQAADHTPSLRAGWTTTVDLWPHTGRTHQLRRHLAGAGHPILGDTVYGLPRLTLRGKGLFLWAVGLRLAHPITGQSLSLNVEEPAKFESFRAREMRRWFAHHPELPPKSPE